MYEDEFELTFNLSGEEPQPEQAAQEPPVPPKTKGGITRGGRTHPGDGAGKAPACAAAGNAGVCAGRAGENTCTYRAGSSQWPLCADLRRRPRHWCRCGPGVLCGGYRVAVLYHSNAKAAAELEKQLPGITAVQCDVASRASCELAFRTAEQALGRVDVLVSNAGIAQQKLFTDITPEEWQHMLDVNLTGAFHLCQLALPGMIRRKAGRILTVSSMWGQTGGSCEVHYSAAKAGLIGLTKALAKEEGPSGITVNCVAPGVIDTDMMAAFTAEDKAALAEETPVGRLGSADEVAQLLVFLAGEGAGYITGQVFGVNGGLVI